jgi:hypothetical protein
MYQNMSNQNMLNQNMFNQNLSNQNIRSIVLSPVNSTINTQMKINLDLVIFINKDYKKKRLAFYSNDKEHTE